MIKQVIWSSTIDWPNEVSSVLFFDGCNFNCPYCHNKDLSLQSEIKFDDILEKLLERKSIVDHVILSGGECTISGDFNYTVNTLYNNGFKVGIHTNGSNFDEFYRSRNQISFVGLDIKHENEEKYAKKEFKGYHIVRNNISKYLNFLGRNCIDYEVRTTWASDLLKVHVINIACYLKNNNIKEWILQYEVQDGKKKLYHDQEWYDEILKNLNKIITTRIR